MQLNDIPTPVQDPTPVSEQVMETQEQQQPENKLREALKDYWALKPTRECVTSLVKKARQYYGYLNATGKMALMRLVYEQYNRGFITLASMSRSGIEGELINLPINEFRNLADHVIGLTNQEKLAFESQPVNNDYSTSAQVTLADSILADYAKNKGMGYTTDRATENAFIFGEGSTLKLWDESIGDIKAVDTGAQKIYRNGDVTFIELDPTNLIRDIHVQSFKQNNWFTARIFVNKYELAAAYPDKASEICERSISQDWDNTRLTTNSSDDCDLIPLYMFFHRQTSALPFGRKIFYIDSDLWLEDGALDYREIPIYTNMPAPVQGLNFGYTVAYDLLPLQQFIDILASGVATNVSNFVVTNILVPENCNLGVADIIGSMNLLKYNPQMGKPEALNLVLTPPEVYALWDRVIQRMETLAGINAQMRGSPDENIKSGAQSALQDARAIRFNSRFQKSYADYCAALATGVLQDLQDHPEDKRTGLIAGKANRAYMKEFSGAEVNQIKRVNVSLGSAYLQTDAGKKEIADQIMSTGLIKDPAQYIEVVKTGSLEPLIEGQHRQLMLIKQENEMLSDGGMVKAIMTDDHVTHIMEHANVVADPAMRVSADPKVASVMQATLGHIMEHINLLSTMNPILAATLKLPVLSKPPAPPTGPDNKPPASGGSPIPAAGAPGGGVKPAQPAQTQGGV